MFMKTNYLLAGLAQRNLHGATWLWVAAFSVIGAVFFGFLASTADPLFIAMGLGLFSGIFLLMTPRVVIWLVLTLSLPTGVMVSLADPALGKFVWLASILSFLLWPAALFHLARQRHGPMFCWLALLFVAMAMASTFLQWYSTAETAAGLKRYFQAYGLLFALAFMPFSPHDLGAWKKFLLAMALLQLPFALYEFVVLVPLRGGLESGAEATDVVAGTFNANLQGGGSSAEMVAFLFIALAFLTARWQKKLLGTRLFFLLALVCFLPLCLGETKIALILLPLTAAVLLRKEFMRAPFRHLPKLVALAALTVGLAFLYAVLFYRTPPAEMFNVLNDYNFGTRGYGENMLNRTTVISFWWDQHSLQEPISFFFGHGVGSSYWAVNNPVAGHVGVRFPHYGIDLSVASTLLWDVGLAGTLLYNAIFVAAWVAGNRVLRSAKDPSVVADVLAIQSAIAIFVLYIVYDSSALHLLPFQVIIAVVLGYLAYLYRQTVVPPWGGRESRAVKSDWRRA